MKRLRFLLLTLLFVYSGHFLLFSQAVDADPHDFGRMWTFENPPVEWFRDAYGFDPGQEWFDHVRKSSVRFASWCSGSFVSPDGLIMTNHHCSRGVSLQVEKEGEDFSENGFYAQTMAEERRVPGMFVEQLIQAVDISVEYDSLVEKGMTPREIDRYFKEKFGSQSGWDGLRIQIISYYSGARHSLYGFKRFGDIRLVMVPEVQVGFYGGEEDNFTYPRYNLDFTFWRAYDDDGQPMNTSAHYMKFNPNGPENGEPVFVVGNPARTERYKSVSQLEFDRDIRYPMMIDFYSAMYDQMKEQYEKEPSSALMNQIFGLSNSLKVFNGVLKGLKNPELMGRKIAMEQKLRSSGKDDNAWEQMDQIIAQLKEHAWAENLLGATPAKGASFMLMHSLTKYERQIREAAGETETATTKDEILKGSTELGTEGDRRALVNLLDQVERYMPEGMDGLSLLKEGRSNAEYVDYLFGKSAFYSEKGMQKLMDKKPDKFLQKKDPLLEVSRYLVPAYERATEVFRVNAPRIDEIEKQIAKRAFQVFGKQLPPDATFTLRISDGVVKGYEYNGTLAPYQTTFFGMYDRYYSHEGEPSWDLPEKWLDPVPEMLRIPVNFVSTNDIIGGNSGSPIINRNGEVVGLVFDGNIESLPGNFIFDDKYNRSVSVHTAGILAALQYIYKADRIYMELLGKR